MLGTDCCALVDVWCVLFVVCVIWWLLRGASCSLVGVRWLKVDVCCTVIAVYLSFWLMSVVCWLLFVVCCLMRIVC